METVSFDDFKKLDLRIAKVTGVEDHPNADRLYVLRIEVEGGEKQIVGGLRQYYTPEKLLGREIVVINNLEPVTIRGQESNGMLLAAKDGDVPVILCPERDVPPGAEIG